MPPEGQCRGTKSACDGKADCPMNQLCCLGFNIGIVERQAPRPLRDRPQLSVSSGECAHMPGVLACACP